MKFIKVITVINNAPCLINIDQIIDITQKYNGNCLITTTQLVNGSSAMLLVREDFDELTKLVFKNEQILAE